MILLLGIGETIEKLFRDFSFLHIPTPFVGKQGGRVVWVLPASWDLLCLFHNYFVSFAIKSYSEECSIMNTFIHSFTYFPTAKRPKKNQSTSLARLFASLAFSSSTGSAKYPLLAGSV